MPVSPRVRRIAVACIYLFVAVAASAQRTTVSLDGTWQIAQGTMEKQPASFDATVDVPGLVDMAIPAFAEVGKPSKLRDAFWYRRTFKIDGAVPVRATLKVHKAAYGTRVFINGKLAGDHFPSFTPGYFDVRERLRGDGAENELIVRVGADPDALPDAFQDGHDFEKVIYQPGIYDSVELILSGAPWIESVQVVPDVKKSTVRIVADLGDIGLATQKAQCVVREAKSRREVARTEAQIGHPAHTRDVDTWLSIPAARLWTPDDPFLYEAEMSTGGDNVSVRFGMRSFAFDQQSGRAVLNGKPIIMRGTNVCIFRFFEDSQRGKLPWDRDWVARLHSSFRDMHWNSIRYCIGFPPQLWYDIADEQGFLIQDEFPLWGGRRRPVETKPEDVSIEYAEWMREHWNHPCVVIWDAQNETVTTVTGAAIRKVRKLDLSNRPWDNGWAPDREPGDSFECHPYIFGGGARLADLPTLPAHHLGTPQRNKGKNAMIINEYGWLWLNRDGSPCTLTEKIYANILGTTATAEQRRHFYGRTLAALTEYWRAQRRFAGVLHFCGLSYSRPGGQTSDNFIDVRNLKYEPNFYKYVRDAFAPVGVCVEYYDEEGEAGRKVQVPVSVINDRDAAVDAEIELMLTSGTSALQTETRKVRVAGVGKETTSFDVTLPSGLGECRIVATLKTEGQEPVRSLRDVQVVPAESLQLVAVKSVRASSSITVGDERYPAKYVADGKGGTRWAAEPRDEEWIAVELDEPTTISRIDLKWENAHAKAYAIEVSQDGEKWTEVYRRNDSAGGREKIPVAPVEARWVRMKGIQRAKEWGYSIWEFRVMR